MPDTDLAATIDAAWEGRIVGDEALTSCIQELRQGLRDHARKPRYLETVHKRGFRFIAPLTTTPQVSGSGVRDRGSLPNRSLTPDP